MSGDDCGIIGSRFPRRSISSHLVNPDSDHMGSRWRPSFTPADLLVPYAKCDCVAGVCGLVPRFDMLIGGMMSYLWTRGRPESAKGRSKKRVHGLSAACRLCEQGLRVWDGPAF